MLGPELILTLVADTQLPDPGDASFVGTAGVFGTLLGGVYGLIAHRSIEEAEHTAFVGGLLGAGLGLLTYVVLVITGVASDRWPG
jgi:hypothetical protein